MVVDVAVVETAVDEVREPAVATMDETRDSIATEEGVTEGD